VADLSNYRFTASHEWVHVDGSNAKIGISDHAQAQLGDVIFLELPAVGGQSGHEVRRDRVGESRF
jgi:glycine cleavage system H lipoate-binding protein